MELIKSKKKVRKLIKGHENLVLTDREKELLIKKASKQFGKFLSVLGYDWENDAHMKETPFRFTKAWVNELFSGNFKQAPRVTSFEEKDESLKYNDGVIIQRKIEIHSTCSHHLLEISGIAHIAYKTNNEGTVIGLSKLNRLADYIARRPQVQERLTRQIHDIISENIPGNKGVAVYLSCTHGCVSCRGIGHDSEMDTIYLSGDFKTSDSLKQEFLFAIGNNNK